MINGKALGEYVYNFRAARFVKSRYTKYSSVSDMLDELGWPYYIFTTFNDLDIGIVCALYQPFVIVPFAHFCNNSILDESKPQTISW